MAGSDNEHWSVDKRVPLALIITIGLQTAGMAFWVGSLSERVEQMERTIGLRVSDGDRITRLEVKLEGINESLKRIERAVTRSDRPL